MRGRYYVYGPYTICTSGELRANYPIGCRLYNIMAANPRYNVVHQDQRDDEALPQKTIYAVDTHDAYDFVMREFRLVPDALYFDPAGT